MRRDTRTAYQQVELPCPKCRHRKIRFTYKDIYAKGRVRCRTCGSEYTFDRRDASQLKSAINNLDQARDVFARTAQTVLAGAEAVVTE